MAETGGHNMAQFIASAVKELGEWHTETESSMRKKRGSAL